MGSPWIRKDGWLSPGDECEWWASCEPNVTTRGCEQGSAVVSNLCLTSNSLEGSVPPEIGLLTNLVWLNLSRNNLSLSIPKTLARLTNLGMFYLFTNNYSRVSTSLTFAYTRNLILVEYLSLRWNFLTGTIPNELASLTKLSKSLCCTRVDEKSNHDSISIQPPFVFFRIFI